MNQQRVQIRSWNRAEDETLESTEEAVEEVESEVSQSTEESVDDVPLPAKAKKHVRAKLLVEKAKKIVQEANERTEACKLLLKTDLKEYEDAKSELKAGGFDACVSLVEKIRVSDKK